MSKQKRNQGRMNDTTYSSSSLLFIFMFTIKSQFVKGGREGDGWRGRGGERWHGSRGKVMSQRVNKLQRPFLANSIYSRDPISKMSINSCENQINSCRH